MAKVPRTLIAGILLATPASAAVNLAPHSPEAVREKCARHHGVFFDHGGVYGCALPRGTVQCNGAEHCVGYPKRPRQAAPPAQPEYQWRQWPQDQQRW